jgi:SAM-dependent methyltransferase
MSVPCPLCGSSGTSPFEAARRRFYECASCALVFADPAARLPAEEQRRRYLLHENSPSHEGYRKFLAPAVESVRALARPGMKALDYGCGPGPALSALAAEAGIEVADYDPLFRPIPLEPPYEIVFSTECFEHFEETSREIGRVVSLLAPGGLLVVMTALRDGEDFGRWPYARDESHVSFYHSRTLQWIARRFGLEILQSDGRRTVVFRRCA